MGHFSLSTEAVGLDAGCMSSPTCKGQEERDIYGVIGSRRPTHIKGRLYKREYIYDPQADVSHSPQGQLLTYRTTNRDGYREYRSDPSICCQCPLLCQCTINTQYVKTIARPTWEGFKEKVASHRLTRAGKFLYKRPKETVDCSFADAKQLHRDRYICMRGLLRAQERCLLSAACQNLKKMALLMSKSKKRGENGYTLAINTLFSRYVPNTRIILGLRPEFVRESTNRAKHKPRIFECGICSALR